MGETAWERAWDREHGRYSMGQREHGRESMGVSMGESVERARAWQKA